MGLKIIQGNSGSGKTYKLYSEMTDDKKYFAVVPEQYTLETQRTIVELKENKGTMNIDIVSFNRLAKRVFEETGTNVEEMLDDTGKCMVLRKILEDKKDELKVFASKVSYAGFVDEIQSLISEMYQYGIGEKEINDIIEKASDNQLLKSKMEDVLIISESFKEYIKGKFMVAEELMSRLCNIIPVSALIKESIITFDGFTGFTALQYEVIRQLIKYSKGVVITITAQGRMSNCDLFSLSTKTISKLEQICKEENCSIEKCQLEDKDNYRLKGDKSLLWMEENVFSFKKDVYAEKTDAIRVVEGFNPLAECEFVGREINRLVREEGYRYKDIAIVTGDIEGYYHNLEQVFRTYEIPGFIDCTRQINNNPFIESIKALIELIDNNYEYESMFRFLKCGMLDIDVDTVDKLENYIINHGIKSYKRWNMEWKNCEDELIVIRDELLSILNPIYKSMKVRNSNVLHYTKALYEFVESQSMQKKLKEYENYFESIGKLDLAKQYSQIYKKVIEVFDKVVSLLGDEKMKLKEYLGILEAGFLEIKVGIIPPTMDRVVVGDMQRSRLGNIKILFFIGLNDGIVPKSNSRGGILSENDRRFLENENIELAPGERENAFIQKFYLYLNITKMSEKLIITYSKTKSDGGAVRPSYFVSTICNKFPKIKIESSELKEDMLGRISTKKTMEKELAKGLRDSVANVVELNDDWKQLYSIYDDEGKIKVLLSGAFYNEEASNLEKAVCDAMNNHSIRGSVSRIETFAACAYQHFLSYDLHIVKRGKFEVNGMDIGNIYHKSLQIFSERLRDKHLSWDNLSEEDRKEVVNEVTKIISSEYEDTAIYSSARNKYQLKRIFEITDRTTWALCKQVEKGKFVPEGFEVDFDSYKTSESLKLELDNGTVMNLKGKIDRIDMYETDDSIYVKIIDYKSGNKTFDILDVYNGLQLQLVLYLEAAMDMISHNEAGKKVIPAGVFYYDIKEPVVDEDKADDIEHELLKAMRPNGLINNAVEVIEALDKEHIEGEKEDSDVAPISFTKSGYRASDKIVSEEDFNKLVKFVHNKTKKLGKDISEGYIQKNPYRINDASKRNPCTYCDFKPICRFDESLPGNSYRDIDKVKPSEVWSRIIDEVNEDGN